jgi:hypothetical protein
MPPPQPPGILPYCPPPLPGARERRARHPLQRPQPHGEPPSGVQLCGDGARRLQLLQEGAARGQARAPRALTPPLAEARCWRTLPWPCRGSQPPDQLPREQVACGAVCLARPRPSQALTPRPAPPRPALPGWPAAAAQGARGAAQADHRHGAGDRHEAALCHPRRLPDEDRGKQRRRRGHQQRAAAADQPAGQPGQRRRGPAGAGAGRRHAQPGAAGGPWARGAGRRGGGGGAAGPVRLWYAAARTARWQPTPWHCAVALCRA